MVRDQGSPSAFETLRFLTIHLVDVNENKPEFPDASNPYKFFILENSARDIRIGTFLVLNTYEVIINSYHIFSLFR